MYTSGFRMALFQRLVARAQLRNNTMLHGFLYDFICTSECRQVRDKECLEIEQKELKVHSEFIFC